MNKKGQLTDTVILMSMIIFQSFTVICLGFLNVSENDITTTTYDNPIVSSFVVNVISNIGQLGWGNLLIFLPLEVGLIYIIAKLVRGGG